MVLSRSTYVAAGVLACVACVDTVPVDGADSYQSSSSSSSTSSSSTSSSSGDYWGSGSSSSGGYWGSSSSSSSSTSSSSSSSSSSGYTPPKPECEVDADCAFRDTDTDPCTTAICTNSKCREKRVLGTPECQCHEVADCTSYTPARSCNQISCDAQHKCNKVILPAGPAPKQTANNCTTNMCDGVAEDATAQPEPTDFVADTNPCTIESCSATGLVRTNVADGTSCGDGDICFQGKCLACKPTNAASCGGEGPDEPANDSSATASTFTQFSPMCRHTSGSDIDWYTFYANDGALSNDVYNFKLWSTAPVLEVCIYAKCVSGNPGGGCAVKLPGPDGSLGCCFTGAPSTLAPRWDLDCSGTGEDSATTYVSVRAPGGDACEQYAITGGY